MYERAKSGPQERPDPALKRMLLSCVNIPEEYSCNFTNNNNINNNNNMSGNLNIKASHIDDTAKYIMDAYRCGHRHFSTSEIEQLQRKIVTQSIRLSAQDKNKLKEEANDSDASSSSGIKKGKIIFILRRLPLHVSLEALSDNNNDNNNDNNDNNNDDNDNIYGNYRVDISDNEYRTNATRGIPLHTFSSRLIIGCPALEVCEESCREAVRAALKPYECLPVFLQGSSFEDKYCENILSPLFHYRCPPIGSGYNTSINDWSDYVEVNNKFFDMVCDVYEDGDLVVVVDFHLMLLPSLIRQRFPQAKIVFFLQSVFPSSEVYRMLPQREDLLRGVLGSDLVSFHSFQYKMHFMNACTRVLGVECTTTGIEPCPEAGTNGVRVSFVPRGINPEPWLREVRSATTLAKIEDLRAKFGDRKVLLAVDTLDFIKGIPHKMKAFFHFLQRYPHWADKCVLIQITTPLEAAADGEDVTVRAGDRQEILQRAYAVAGAINAQYGVFDALPVHFLSQKYTPKMLVPLYAVADVALVTPLRESLSWTAYEFVLCQQASNKGVLVLSEFSGSAQALAAAAVCVNPWDAPTFAEKIKDALEMNVGEKEARHEYAYSYIVKHTVYRWGDQLLHELGEGLQESELHRVCVPPQLDMSLVQTALQTNSKCVLILGLRGVLLPSQLWANCGGITKTLPYSCPPEVLATLKTFDAAAQQGNIFLSIVSSASYETVDDTLGCLTNALLIAENGHTSRLPKTTEWQAVADTVDLSWMDPVREILGYFVQRTPGSYVIETRTSLSWHYEHTQKDFAKTQYRDLLIHLWAGPLSSPRADVIVGTQSVEVRASSVSKATVIEKALRELTDFDPFDTAVVCIGNFLMRDEDVFTVLHRWSTGSAQEGESCHYQCTSKGNVCVCTPSTTITPTSLNTHTHTHTHTHSIS
eukprot:GHVR01176445.1.p1 GENE.GHVR01176445.1~~GHVR01176445.1.p1  ORF type:complete len:925 (+),score=282.67 GHVR01176445.1:105-2879(+)